MFGTHDRAMSRLLLRDSLGISLNFRKSGVVQMNWLKLGANKNFPVTSPHIYVGSAGYPSQVDRGKMVVGQRGDS